MKAAKVTEKKQPQKEKRQEKRVLAAKEEHGEETASEREKAGEEGPGSQGGAPIGVQGGRGRQGFGAAQHSSEELIKWPLGESLRYSDRGVSEEVA